MELRAQARIRKALEVVESTGQVSALFASIPGGGGSGLASNIAGGFGPDYILDLGQQAFGDSPGYSFLAGMNRAATNTLLVAAGQATTSTPVYSQKQANEIQITINQAAASLSNGDYQTAESKTQELLQRDPFDPIAHHLKGRIAAAQGDFKTASTFFDRAVELDPANERFATDAFNARQLQRDDREVLEFAGGMVENPNTALEGVRLLFELVGRSSQTGRIHLDIAKGFKNLNLPTQQMNAFEVVLETGTQQDLKELEAAVKEMISDLNVEVGLPYSILGRVQQRLGRFDEALESLEKARNIAERTAPENNRYVKELGRVHASVGHYAYEKGDISKAEYHFTLAHDMDPLNDEISSGLAGVLVKKAQNQMTLGDDTKARANLARAERLMKTDQSLDQSIADTYMQLGRRALAKGLENLALLNFEDAVERNPDTPGLKRITAELHRDLGQQIIDEGDLDTGDYKRIVEHFQSAYDLVPSNFAYRADYAEQLNNFGLKLMNENSDYQQALEMFEKARNLYPDNQTYLDNYNQALTLYGQEEDE